MFSWSWSRSGGGYPGGDHGWRELKAISSNEKASISCCLVEIQACLSSKVPKPRSTSFSDGLWSVTETQVMGWLLKWASLFRCLISHRLNLSALYRHSLDRDESRERKDEMKEIYHLHTHRTILHYTEKHFKSEKKLNESSRINAAVFVAGQLTFRGSGLSVYQLEAVGQMSQAVWQPKLAPSRNQLIHTMAL